MFTPHRDLHRLSKGATVLDFAFAIHSRSGSHCMGAIVNNKHVTFKYVLQNGDQVSVTTSPNQTPKRDWLQVARTSKARTKIKQAIKELENKAANDGKEVLARRLKNWKIEYNDGDITRLMKKMGYKSGTDFYLDIYREKINLQQLREKLLEQDETNDVLHPRTADGFKIGRAHV